MKKLSRQIQSDANDFEALNRKDKKYSATFEHGILVEIETDDQALIDFAKAKGLK